LGGAIIRAPLGRTSWAAVFFGERVEQVKRTQSAPVVIPRSEHNISRANISEAALKVLYRLKKADYEAYLVGGGVRDLLLGREPKDFDVATEATPDEVRELFRNCRLVGRRFRLAHVRFGNEIVEVATFRGHSEEGEGERVLEDGMLLRDNVYGSLEDDAWRRDFTVNALYYNVKDFSVIDYTGGLTDLRQANLRLIGDPEQRFREDPVRLLRAVRFAAKLGFRLDAAIEQCLFELGELLANVPPARLFDEMLKLFHGGYALQTYELLRHYGLFGHLFPQTEASLAQEEDGFPRTLLPHALANTDRRLSEDKPVTPAFLIAALLWEPVHKRASELMAGGMTELQALQEAAQDVLQEQQSRIAMPRRFTLQAREIWLMQPRLVQRGGRRALRVVEQPRFRAGYDFLLLRAEAGEPLQELCDWWQSFYEAGEEERAAMANTLAPTRKRRRRRKPRARRKASETESGS